MANMFIGSPPGNYDRILDFSRPVTGSLFFVPSQTLLDDFDSLGPGPVGVGPGQGGDSQAGDNSDGRSAARPPAGPAL